MVLIYTAYTPRYAKEAARLASNAVELGWPFLAEPYTDLGDWRQNCLQRPRLIADVLRNFPQNTRICWVDADTYIHRTTDLLDAYDCDFGAVFRKGKLTGGTMLFVNTPNTLEFLGRWYEQGLSRCHEFENDQPLIQEVSGVMEMKNELRVYRMPSDFNAQEHLGEGDPDTVVFGHQGLASNRIWGARKWA